MKEMGIYRRASLSGAEIQAIDLDQLNADEGNLKTCSAPIDIKSTRRRRSRSDPRRKRSSSLVGATAFALSSSIVRDKFDYIFVDEASQVPMANFVAMSSCASSAILVGDQQQLEMPLQGNHPETVNMSCLTFFVGKDMPIVPRSLGLFLERSYRMAPALCNFVSSTVYSNALIPAAGTSCHSLQVKSVGVPHDIEVQDSKPHLVTRGSGIVFIGREQFAFNDGTEAARRTGPFHCPTEVRLAADIMSELVGTTFCAKGVVSTLSVDDILVVAPYNVQVRALRQALPSDARVGTIDKFQGQEAPVVIISTCALPEGPITDIEDVDDFGLEIDTLESLASSERRGTRFALRQNRLNVALSRAQCLAVVIGSDDLLTKVVCKSPEDAAGLSFYSRIVSAGKKF
jgi:superfamily I DNA and/or RNA helicase